MLNYRFLAKFLLLVLIGLFINNSQAQSYQYLKNKWLHDKTDTGRINAGLKLLSKYYKNNNDSVYIENKYLFQIYNLSLNAKYNYGIIESSYNLGSNFATQMIPNKAIEYYFISLKVSEKSKDENGMAHAKMGIGIVYYITNSWPNAIEYFKGSLEIYESLNEKTSISTQQYLIGYSLSALHKFDEAKLYIDSSLKIKFECNDKIGINECRLVLANIYKGQQQYDSALKYYQTLLPIFLEQKEYVPVSFIHSSFAQISFSFGNYAAALKYALDAYKYSLMFISPLPRLQAYEILYKIKKQTGDYENSLYYLQRYNILKDSIENSDFYSQISVSQATYEFEKEQSTIKAEQDKKDLQYKIEIQDKNFKQSILTAILVIALIFVVIIVFAYRWVSKQKIISEDLLLNILPKETVFELKKYGKSLPKNHHEVTIMFCDIKNFSHIAETLSPEAVVEMLDTYFRQFDIIIGKFGVEKIKTIGDAYMCAGGLSKDAKDTAIDTLEAAIEFLEFNKSIEQEMLIKYNHAFYFRIGIHTGNVVSGVVGLKKYSYDIWGDAVNIAARMEQNSIPGKINISESTHTLIKEKYINCSYRGKIPIKNRGDIDMYFVE